MNAGIFPEIPGLTPGEGGAGGNADADRSVRVSVPRSLAEEAGAVLMDILGPFEEERTRGEGQACGPAGEAEERVTLVFYPPIGGPSTREEMLPLLPATFGRSGVVLVETGRVSRDWVEGWREHFRPIVIGAVRVRPPWEPPLTALVADAAPCGPESSGGGPAGSGPGGGAGLPVDVVINPGLGFGTGLHPTTRGTLLLLQEGAKVEASEAELGPLTDVGTGSGILAIAAAKLGWGPVVALDNDPVALVSARENVSANGVEHLIEIHEADTESAEEAWFAGATVLANMTLEPVSLLLRRLAAVPAGPRRLVVSGILAGSQEDQTVLIAHDAGFAPGQRLYEAEWVSFELLPRRPKA